MCVQTEGPEQQHCNTRAKTVGLLSDFTSQNVIGLETFFKSPRHLQDKAFSAEYLFPPSVLISPFNTFSHF